MQRYVSKPNVAAFAFPCSAAKPIIKDVSWLVFDYYVFSLARQTSTGSNFLVVQSNSAALSNQYKSKISDEMDLKRRIQSLEESMELHERMKRQALAEFESYRQRVEDMQLCTEAQVRPVTRARACVCVCMWASEHFYSFLLLLASFY